MQLLRVKGIVTAIWILAVCATAIVVNVNSVSSWLLVAAVAVIPPMVMMWWWQDPAQSMSESIQDARR